MCFRTESDPSTEDIRSVGWTREKGEHVGETTSNVEMGSLQRFVPTYFATVSDWLTARIAGRAHRGRYDD